MHFISDSKTCSALERVGWNYPEKPFGRTVRQKAWSPPAHSGGSPASKLRVAPCATSVLPTISPHPWVTQTVTGRVTCVFHAPVTFPRPKRPLNLIRIFTPLPLQRPQKQEM